MKIVVLIKPVPLEISFDENGFLTRNKFKSVINSVDKHALEEAIKIKKCFSGEIIVASMGLKSSINVLEEALIFGADRGILINDSSYAGSDTNATAYILKGLIKKLGKIDLILCGNYSSDSATGQVGIELASKLNVPFATNVSKLDFINKKNIIVSCEADQNNLTIKMKTPLLLTLTNQINTLHIPSVSDIVNAKNKSIKTLSAKELKTKNSLCGILGSPTKVLKTKRLDLEKKECIILNGNKQEQIQKLVEILQTNLKANLQNNFEPFSIINQNYSKEIFVFCQIEKNQINNSSLNLLAKAYELALGLKAKVSAIYVGDNEESLNDFFKHGANQVYFLKTNSNDYINIAENILKLVKKYKPEIFLFDRSYVGKIVSSYIAAKLNTGLSADCIDLSLNDEGNLIQKRLVYDGKMLVDIICPQKRPQMATTNLKNNKIIYNENNNGKVIKINLNHKNYLKDIKVSEMDCDNTRDLVISIGAGITDIKVINKLKDLAIKYNGFLGCSRMLVDKGIQPVKNQIGLTGKIVNSKVYLACGISGAAEHMAGISSNILIAINKDPNANIFNYADYGIIADINDIILLLEKEMERKSEK